MRHTGSPCSTTPFRSTTFLCLNWPIIAASRKKRTLSSDDSEFKVFTATTANP